MKYKIGDIVKIKIWGSVAISYRIDFIDTALEILVIANLTTGRKISISFEDAEVKFIKTSKEHKLTNIFK